MHGRILGMDDVVNFEGVDVDELEQAFHEAVDDYLALRGKLANR
jgi:predicted HicB family RNase H-like nuclease